ncbi:MAG TPA: chalcone isomerase family protein [Burkholderiaceae bacterium]|nr:chalcone isomerase family protein [Burkholderiaceae bacterium]
MVGTALVWLATSGAWAQTVDVADVRYERTVKLQDQNLLLNGAGVRYKAVFKVYTAGLYLTQKANSPEEVWKAPGPKRIHIVMLRDIDANELGKLFTRGVEDNTPRNDMSQLVPGLIRMSDIFSRYKKLMTGDTFTVDWLPEQGTVISVKGQPQGEPFKEPAFFQALMRIWLGNNPADSLLKDALLGKERRSVKN